MKKTARKVKFVFLLFVVFSVASSVAYSEVEKIAYTGTSTVQHDGNDLSAITVLEHNYRLLSGTTISESLIKSSSSSAKAMYLRARSFYNQAVTHYRSGRQAEARSLAYQSIRTFYQADKLHNNIVAN